MEARLNGTVCLWKEKQWLVPFLSPPTPPPWGSSQPSSEFLRISEALPSLFPRWHSHFNELDRLMAHWVLIHFAGSALRKFAQENLLCQVAMLKCCYPFQKLQIMHLGLDAELILSCQDTQFSKPCLPKDSLLVLIQSMTRARLRLGKHIQYVLILLNTKRVQHKG